MYISFVLLKESNEINILKVIILTTKIPGNAGNILWDMPQIKGTIKNLLNIKLLWKKSTS